SGASMNRDTAKLILPLDSKRSYSSPAPVKALFALAPPREVFRKQAVRFEPLSRRQAFLELVTNTFNYRIADTSRLQRQLRSTSSLVHLFPVRRLSIPRDLNQLPSVREAIVANLKQPQTEVVACVN